MNAFYTVGNQSYNNLYLALYKAMETGQTVKFYLEETLYDQYNWTADPGSSLDDIMRDHAYNLRNKYDRLILLYSGGYDSHTAYNVFAKHRIHLDAIVTGAAENNPFFPMENYEWVKRNHWDPDTEIRYYNSSDLSYKPMLKNPDWIHEDTGHLVRYHSTSFNAIENMFEEKYSKYKWAYVTGLEKPRLVYRAGQWFSRQAAQVLEQGFGMPHIESFFLEPQVAIKQSHVLKKNVKAHILKNKLPLYDGDWAEAKYGRDREGMHDWNLACGRISELNYGISQLQKAISEKVCGLSDINTKGPWTDIELVSNESKFLIDDLKKDSIYAKNFLRGIYEIYNEPRLRRWLDDNNMFRDQRKNPLFDLKFIWSKEYNLGQ